MKFKSYAEEKKYYEQEANQEEFLAWYQQQDLPKYEKPSVTVDNVILGWEDEEVKLLLIRRKANPFKGYYALPGGFVDKTEDTTEAVLREVKEEVGLTLSEQYVEQLKTIATPGRDPRAWTITVAHLTYLPAMADMKVVAGDDAREAHWVTLQATSEGKPQLFYQNKEIPLTELAFDHEEIIQEAVIRIKNRLDYIPTVLKILGGTFTLTEARKVYSKFLGIPVADLDNSNFRKTHGKFFTEVGLETKTTKGRPRKIYRLKSF
ncbi:NUDIX domain-containing protein [Enterococcus sp. LJL51]|uniref:NUDIX domain-containing protein n=1 Tax=Enterococcus sp. LJL51 TaxID=3416656 RepID=UPI003CF1B0E6